MNVSIRTKLFFGFGIVLILFGLMAYLLTLKLREANDRTTNIVEISSKKIILSHEILVNVMNAARHEKNMILESEPLEMQRYEDGIRDAIKNIDTKTAELSELVDEKGAQLLESFHSKWKSYSSSLDEIISLAEKNQDEIAFKISAGKGYRLREEALTSLNLLVQKNEQSMMEDKRKSDENYSSAMNLIIFIVVLSLLISTFVAYWIVSGIGKRISFISQEAQKISSREHTEEEMKDTGQDELSTIFNSLVTVNQSFREITQNANSVASGNYSTDFTPRSERDALGNALKKMTFSLRETTAENKKHTWLTTGQNQLNETLRGDKTLEELSNHVLTFLCTYTNTQVGAFYLLGDDNMLTLTGRYAFSAVNPKEKFALGEGLIGQVAAGGKPVYLSGIEEEHVRVVSALMDAKPKSVYVVPFTFEGRVLGVIELGNLSEFNNVEKEFILSCLESIGISVNSALSRKRIQQLLEETQVQSEELQSQQEELKQINEELEEQAQNLKQQQEELQMTNEDLEEQTQALETKNREVERAKLEVEQKTKQLEVSSRYKSEFLANMSHELRTPLNSLLILSKDLHDNRTGNLTPDQVESAEIINKSGHDLLALINEVLDLSKIEAGKMHLNTEQINLLDFANGIFRDFKRPAEKKSLKLTLKTAADLPKSITSDSQRLSQILKNLLSNAIKFTERGEITLTFSKHGNDAIAISVADTGIGIPEDKQMAIFEAFQQADGGTSRKYGGTGLGLSISRELAKLLNGEISVKSELNKGSVFTLTLPLKVLQEGTYDKKTTYREPQVVSTSTPVQSNYLNHPTIEDDRKNIVSGDKVVLIIEDDLNFATVLRNQARNKGFKSIAASTGEDGLKLAQEYVPSAVILDIDLPGMDGHQVLAELKANHHLRHIPVHIMSVNERSMDPIKNGAVEYLTKPVDKKQVEEAFSRIESFIERKMKNLLIIEDDANSRKAIRKLIGNGDVHSFEAGSGKEAIEIFKNNHVDCIVLDIGLPDISGFELIHKFLDLKKGMPPVIIYTGRELTKKENDELQKYSDTIIIKGTKSEERLLDETALFLHRTIDNLPASKQKIITNLYDKELIFQSKRILLVDDDMRNVFALSKVLKEKGMEIIKAENGLIALEELNKNSSIDLVLMDIMMPEMDGYEAMQKIRATPTISRIPIIALTAKAMKEDKQKCIDAGANDYITKPVDVERLLSLMRVWLSK